MTAMTVVLVFDEALTEDLTDSDIDYAERNNWAWPLYRCPLCNNMTGLAAADKAALDTHFFDLNGHWRKCTASGALVTLNFGEPAPTPAAPRPVPSAPSRRRRPRRRRR